MRTTRTIFTLLMVTLLSLAAAAADYVTITGNDVRLRMKPSTRSETLTNTKGLNVHPAKGERLECLGESGDFYQVLYKGKKVFVSKQFAKPDGVVKADKKPAAAQPAKKGAKYVVVTGQNVRLRQSPSLKGAIYSANGKPIYPKKGQKIKLIGEEGDFYKVNFEGNYLYISKQFSQPAD